ncbi:ArsR family transcriptional regulator [Alicyclobacillus sacchari]|uniref:ArsR family transcriptional regulator n=1 Tax=Alicyclobacillus sacchari TaxID=392010 RepID=A0A4R8LC03_9BACL|nr:MULTISPECIES: metalloregulator ArsR/SmtB family transcription factor [Alicyclobacillus]TDY40463.1 ArsR family transcriptional regulator [Alicyclobacillus sacchari]GLG01730.1 HTH-type transcriptional repressor AseR [Alicyclobacillus hesperidum subsp. aegles]GMA58062.1 HTH-type transcriptional repressor AseR [Alicyclobacillus sacchari]
MEFDQLAEALKALGDPTRLKIVALLQTRDCCVCELVPMFGISQPAISKHMSRLKTSGLVKETRKGMWVFYSLNRERLNEIGLSLANLPDLSEELRQLEQKGMLVQCE